MPHTLVAMTADTVDDTDDGALPEHARLGEYRLVQPLGEGGMGVVHLALDRHGRAVALKVLRAHVAHDPQARARLAREVETLSRIRSPRVAPVIDADIDGERPYIVTRYVPGPSLEEVVGAEGPMDAQQLHRLGAGLADALDVIHSAEVIHRDLKPGNVLLLDGDPVVIDFGIAHAVDDIRLTMTGLVMGTPGYLAPEVVEGEPVTRATDWWGWAATLAFAASGAPPFGRGPMDAVLARVSRGEPDLSEVDPHLAPLLYAALSPRPDERPHQSEVVSALERYARGEPVTSAVRLRRVTPPTQALAVPSTSALPVRPAPVERPAQGPGRAAPMPLPPSASPPPSLPAYAPVPPAAPPWPGQRRLPHRASDLVPAPPPVDPRIGRPNRTGTILALLALAVAGAAAAPAAAGIVALVWVVLARTADRSLTSVVLRRHERGPRRSDVPLAVMSSPWHLVVGLVAAVFSVVIPALVGISGAFSVALAVVAVRGGGSASPGSAPALAMGGLCAALMAWWGPGGASLRRGSRSLLRGVSPGEVGGRVAAGLALVAAVALVAWVVVHGAPTWWPNAAPPSFLAF